ncbi:hypothetical protein BVRB_2g039020 [Beta vulgaris subsp. vulgaris]|nr:hypothetical protein BVRB_2g039020 [Beta vulgaris subsp. vulgaris]
MSDQSDSQNAFDEVFITESDPSSSSVDPISEPDSSPVGRTRLLADIPPTIDRERELRSKFLNDPSTPEEHNLTLKYLTARQSGDKQTLRELRHQILARRSRRHPPADAVPGDDSNSSTSAMAQDDHAEAVYHRRTDNANSKAPVTEENLPSDQEDGPDVGPGSGWQDAFFWLRVPEDYPLRRHFTEPAPHKEHLPLEPLTEEESKAFNYFSSVDYDITFEDGRVVRSKEPSIWLPHSKYILGDKPLSAVRLSRAYENGFGDLDLDALGVDQDYRPLTHLPAAPSIDYPTMHSVTNGRRGGNRHGPQNLRRGRGGAQATRGATRRRQREPAAADSAANKRQAVEDPGTSAANEVVQVEDLDPTAPGETDGLVAGVNDPAPVSGTSWLSGSASSIREKIRELITRPSFLTSLSPGIFYRYREWIKKKEVPLTDSVAAAFAPSPVTVGKVYQPAWDVREDKSLYSDIPENGGILAYRILKGMQLPLDRPSGSLITPADRLAHDQLIANNAALELIEQYLEYQRLTDSYKASLETCQGLLRDAEEKLAPLEDEVATLRDRATLLEETEENVKALTKAVEAANNEKEIAVLDASTAEARGAANAVAKFKASDEYVCHMTVNALSLLYGFSLCARSVI